MILRRGKPSAIEEEKPRGFDDFELRLGDVMRGERATLGKSLLDVQRELKIKATYIAAIENCDTSAFETQGFVAGYVRSYARYLAMDPEWAYARFCAEANFSVAHGMSAEASTLRVVSAPVKAKPKTEYKEPLANPNATFVPRGRSLMSGVHPSGIGSVLVLLLLIGGIGYGGWSVLQQVQRVQVAPIDQAPSVVADLDPLASVAKLPAGEKTASVNVPSSDALDRLYRPQALDVPVMVPRDGPIAAINPNADATTPVTTATTGTTDTTATQVAAALASSTGATDPNAPQVVASAAPSVQIFAVRPSWVRVQAADGTVLFEKILDAGEHYTVPQTEQPAKLRAGNSGSVYFEVNGKTYGPAAPGSNVVRNLALSAENLRSTYSVASVARDPDLAKYAVADASATH
ncbi:MAG: helix-turn-helix domain-containing protein [Paracoccaceae bacterium]|nr:helix-turn-helix domain-containing protein [Paracoccaceae bacterium]